MADVWRISEAASLGLHTMAYLAQHPERRATTREIAQSLHVSEHHLAKVHQWLARAGLIETVRGPHGGVQLTLAPEQVTLLQVYEAIEGPLRQCSCLLGQPACGRTTCIFGGLVQSLNRQVQEYMGGTTLAQVAERA